MINPPDKVVCDKHKSKKKGICQKCGVCRCCDAPPVCPSNINHFGDQIKSLSEQKKIILNKTTIYYGRDRLSLIDELDLCDDGNILSNKDNLLKIGKLLGVEAKTCDEIPNNGWNMMDIETQGRKIVRSKQILNEFQKIDYLICPQKPIFH